MKKRSLLLTFLVIGLFLINFISAYNGGSSLSDLLNQMDSSTIFLGAIFIIAFAFINYSLSKVFRDNKATAGIVAFCVSFLITYGINKTGFDFEGLFYNLGYSIGLSGDILYMVIFLVLIAGIVYLIWKFAKESLIIIGILLIVASFFTYEKIILIFLGLVLIISRFFIKKGTWEREKKPKNAFEEMRKLWGGR